MTRTIYNWSELLDEYRGKGEKKKNKLKKWSDMGNPEPSSNNDRPKRDSLKNKTVFIHEVEVDNPHDLGYIQSKNSEFNIRKHKSNPESKQKIALLQLLYDTIGQDTETIPAMYADIEETKLKLTEKDNLMIDLLEMNIRNKKE